MDEADVILPQYLQVASALKYVRNDDISQLH